MRLSLIALGAAFLLLAGWRPQALPFVPEAQFSDSALAHWPAALHLREAVLQQGGLPVWQQTILGGGPFAANPLNKTAYPLQWLALILPPALHLNLLIALHLLLAGWGMWRWARRVDLPEEAALLSGLAYALAPKIIAHTGAGHVDLLYALAWWPWLMEAVHHMAGAREGWLCRGVQTGFFAALIFLADVRLSLFALMLAAAYGLWEATRNQQWRGLRGSLPGAVVFGVLTLPVTVPLLGWQTYLSRSSMAAADAGVFSLEGGHFVGLLLPPHGGNPETFIYLGLAALLLAVMALAAAHRKHTFWLGAIILAVLYALGINGPLWPVLVNALPILRWFRVPSRAWFVVVLIGSLLAGYGLQALMTTVERLRAGEAIHRLVLKRLAVAGALGASLFCGGFTLAVLTDLSSTIGIGVIVTGALLGVVLLLALYGRLSAGRLALALTLIVFADAAWTGIHWVEWRGPERWLTHQDRLAEALEAENPTRIYSPNYALEQQVAADHGLRLFYGVDPFQLAGMADAIARASGVPVTKYSVVLPPLELEPEAEDDRTPEDLLRAANQDALPDTQVLAAWGVSHVVTTYPVENDRLALREQVDGDYIYANLDYDSSVAMNAYGWPEAGWPGLPDEATVAALNRNTWLAALVAGVGFLLCGLLLGWRKLRP